MASSVSQLSISARQIGRSRIVVYLQRDVRKLDELDLGRSVPILFNLATVHMTPDHEP